MRHYALQRDADIRPHIAVVDQVLDKRLSELGFNEDTLRCYLTNIAESSTARFITFTIRPVKVFYKELVQCGDITSNPAIEGCP
ncbi:MAG: hypothetical protein HKM24_01395 [Gammaproteobacteria bacterium]|nr:hypothetical protein [Gammaproteobacteria bacterium]